MNMIERVARAIEATTKYALSDYTDYSDMARAAIAAMREPTEEMLQCGCHDCGHQTTYWQAMIDAALERK